MNLLIKLGGRWYFNRWVPQHIRHLDRRELVRQSTKVRVADDPKAVTAMRIAHRMNDDLEIYWRNLARGRGAQAWAELQVAIKRARALGVEYIPAAELIGQGVPALLQRVLMAAEGPQDLPTFRSLLGTAVRPQASGIKLSDLFDEFRKQVEVEIGRKDAHQTRTWSHKHTRATSNLIEVVGDKDVAHLTNQDAQEFRRWWKDRIADEQLQRDTANKDFEHIAKMLAKVSEQLELGLAPYFVKLRFQGSDEGNGVPFSPKFVQERLLADGALDELNPEARRVLYVMTETGLRPSEIVALESSTGGIHLDAEVPHIAVRAVGREVKSRNALRKVPLVGVALKALQAQPDGFPRYRGKPASLSAVVNKFLTQAQLRETPEHTLYSLRHTFQDRLRSLKPSDEFMRMLMGHATRGPKYGTGYELSDVVVELKKIAFKAPARI